MCRGSRYNINYSRSGDGASKPNASPPSNAAKKHTYLVAMYRS